MAINPSRTGQNNASGDAKELFKEKAMTDILEFFKTTLTISEHITHKSIDNGKSASFPVIGTASAQYLSAGDELNGEKIKHTERIISIDDLLVSHAYIYDLDAAMEHYDSESAYMVQIKESLKRAWEQDAYRTLVQAAAIKNSADAAAAGLKEFDDQKYNTPVEIPAADIKKGMSIYQAILDGYDQWFANENIGEACVALQPAQYSALLANPATTGTTFVDDPASQSGKVPLVAGMKVYRTPYLPKGVVAASAAVKAKYAGDYTGTLGVIFSKGAIGVLSLKELQVELSREHKAKSDLMSADMAVGFGILNPACAVLIATENSAVTEFYVTVSSVALSPASPSIEVGDTQAMSLVLTMSDSSTQTITSGFTLTSATPANASVSGNVVTGVAAGTSVLTATYKGKTATTTATVTL